MRFFMAGARILRRWAFLWAAFPLVLIAGGAWGACVLNVADASPRFVRVSSHGLLAVPRGHLRVTFIGHSSFLVETPGGASLLTDYNGRDLPPGKPDAVTMSNPHRTHSSEAVDPDVPLVLRGWNPTRGIAKVDVRIKDARVFNIPTNFIEAGGFHTNTNSIFVVEAAGLCVAHLGNLRHLLERESLQELGRIDVLFLSIDGTWTLSHPDALRVIRQIGPSLVIPMHFDFRGPEPFATLAKKSFPVKVHDQDHLLFNRKTLPPRTEILFMRESGWRPG
ncbi:MAG: MBL fold metallo-hydrolase [Nitrospinota bacterium]